MTTETPKTRAISARFCQTVRKIRVNRPPTMEPGNPPQIGYASCKATIGKSQPVRKFEVNRYANLKSKLFRRRFAPQPSAWGGFFLETFSRAGVEPNPARGRKLGACGQIIFEARNAAAPAGRICYTYVAENRRWPRPKSGHSPGNANAGPQCWGPGTGTAKNLPPRLWKIQLFGGPFWRAWHNTDIGYGT